MPGIARLIKEKAAHTRFDKFMRTVACGDDSGKAAGHGLQRGVGAGIIEGGVEEEVCRTVKGGGVLRAAEVKDALS